MTDQFFGITDTGKERTNNEDAFIARQSADGNFIVACVIDGVGGYAGGEVAAAIARAAILERLEGASGDIISVITDCLELANERIILEKQKNKEYAQMSCVCTLTLADITNNRFYYAHVGDTRLYLLRDHSLVKISHDQSFVGFLEESGRISESEAMNHPKRNEINKALGFERSLTQTADYIETGQSPFLSGDMLLLCSDGLSDMMGSSEITGILTKDISIKEKGRALVDAANHHGGKDNITAVLVHNNKAPQQHTATAVKRENVTAPPASRVTEQPAADDEPGTAESKSKGGLIAVLVVLVLLFAGAAVYFYLQTQKTTPTATTAMQQPVAADTSKKINPLQVKLQKAIDSLKGNTLVLSDTDYKTPIILSNAIMINRDSLHIKAHGKIIFQADSGYKSAAIKLSAKVKSVLIDSVAFNGFDTAIALTNNTLELKNVQFVNCKQTVTNQIIAAGTKKYTNGKLAPVSLKTDSLPVTHKK